MFYKTLGRREEDEASRRMFLNNNDHREYLIMRQETCFLQGSFHPVWCLYLASLLAQAGSS